MTYLLTWFSIDCNKNKIILTNMWLLNCQSMESNDLCESVLLQAV